MVTAEAQAAAAEEEKPWHTQFPSPRTADPKGITREELLDKLQNGQTGGLDFLLVDLRRGDFAGGTIHSSLNLPAQTLYYSLRTVYNLCVSAKIPVVIFYCGSSRGRGTRAAGWLADFIADQAPAESKEAIAVESCILKGGIKGWVAGGEEYTRWMDGFEAEVWKS